MRDASSDFTVRTYAALDGVPAEWREAGRAQTAFQSWRFLSAWYATFGQAAGIETIFIEVRRARDDRGVFLWPMILRRRMGLRWLEPADGGVSDNNAPLLGPAWPLDRAQFASAWAAFLGALPHCDLLSIEKVPKQLGSGVNPIASVPGAQAGGMSRNVLPLPERFEDYLRARPTKFRKEQERIGRVFDRAAAARFELICDADLIARAMNEFDRLHASRLDELGLGKTFENPAYAAFYRALAAEGHVHSVCLGVLLSGDALVAGLFVLTHRDMAVLVRVAHAGGEWSKCSPGRLVIDRTMQVLHANGYRQIDFSIGDYRYKRAFQIQPEPLSDLAIARTLKGRAFLLARGAYRGIKAWRDGAGGGGTDAG